MTKDLTYQTGKVTTDSKEGHWSTAFEFAPPSQSEKASRGVLVAAISITASPKFDSALAGDQVLSALQEDYYAQTTGGILPALERAVTSAHQRLITLVFSGQGEEEAVDFNLVVGVLWGSVFYLAQLGESRAVIRRGGELKLIGHRTGAEDGDLAVGDKPDIRVASGLLEVGDKIILGTPKFFDIIPAEELSRVLENGPGDYVAGKLKDKYADEPEAAALVLSLGVEGIPSPAEDAVVLAEPVITEKEEVAPEVTKEDVVEAPAEVKEPEPVVAELSAQVSKDVGKFSDNLQAWGKKIMSLAVVFGAQAYRVVRGSGVGKHAKKLFGHAWKALGSPRTAVEGATEAKNRRTLIILAGALLIILLASIGINSLFKGDSSKRLRFDNLVKSAQAEYDEAETSASLNRAHAKDLLVTATTNLKDAGDLHIDDSKVKDLQAKIAALLQTVNLVYKVDPATFYDLTILKAGASGADLAGDKGVLYVLDPTGGLYQLSTADRKGVVLSSDLSLSKGQSLALNGTNLFSFVAGQGVFGYDLKAKKLSQTSKLDSAWGRIADLTSYNGNVYLLDAGKNQIWRYSPISAAQFGPSTQWLKEDAVLSSASSIQVDGNVWVGQAGDLLRFASGKRDSFLTQDVFPALSNVKAVFTTVDTTSVYLLEPGRVVVTDKNGAYQAQYTSDKFQTATSLIVDEAGKKAYVLADKIIYLLELR